MGQAPYVDLDALPIAEALAQLRVASGSAPLDNAEDRFVAWGSGQSMRVRLYHPGNGHADLPVLMHLHGGGFVTGSIEMDDARCARLARDVDCIVASVDYPLAPEYSFPAPIEAAFAAWRWITDEASEFGGDPRRAAISGSSAGGHLAIGVCFLTRERGVRAPLLQVLAYPVVDPGLATETYRRYADGPFLTRARMAWYWKQYQGSEARSEPFWAPLAASLSGLPSAFVVTAEHDVLRGEAEAYADRLTEAGIDACVSMYEGMIHGFVTTLPNHAMSVKALDDMAAALRLAFAEAK
jgi:acetyl esterase